MTQTNIIHPPAAPPVRQWLRLEGLAAIAAAVLIYFRTGHSWPLFAILFLVPDLSFAGYLLGPRLGAIIYNTFHSYVLPAALAGALWLTGYSMAIPLIWTAHIGMDRMLGLWPEIPHCLRGFAPGPTWSSRQNRNLVSAF